MPAWLLLLIQAAPEIAKAIKSGIDYFESLSEQDKQKVRDQLGGDETAADTTNDEFDKNTLDVLATAQAEIDAMPDDHAHKPIAQQILAAVKAQLAAPAAAQ